MVIDGSQPLCDEDHLLLAGGAVTPKLVVISKADRPRAWAASELGVAVGQYVDVSSTTGA